MKYVCDDRDTQIIIVSISLHKLESTLSEFSSSPREGMALTQLLATCKPQRGCRWYKSENRTFMLCTAYCIGIRVRSPAKGVGRSGGVVGSHGTQFAKHLFGGPLPSSKRIESTCLLASCWVLENHEPATALYSEIVAATALISQMRSRSPVCNAGSRLQVKAFLIVRI
jgi:hypothetical protein